MQIESSIKYHKYIAMKNNNKIVNKDGEFKQFFKRFMAEL